MSTFTPTIASLTRDLENADRAASDRLAHCQRLTQENAELLAALKDCYSELNQLAFLHGDKLASITLNNARAIIARCAQE